MRNYNLEFVRNSIIQELAKVKNTADFEEAEFHDLKVTKVYLQRLAGQRIPQEHYEKLLHELGLTVVRNGNDFFVRMSRDELNQVDSL